MMSFTKSISTCFKKSFSYSGRATRAEYWWFQLFVWGVLAILCWIAYAVGYESEPMFSIAVICAITFYVVTLFPNIAVCVRRWHDRGLSGAYLCLLCLLTGLLLAFPIINIVNMLRSSADNEYGPNPFNSVVESENVDLSSNS